MSATKSFGQISSLEGKTLCIRNKTVIDGKRNITGKSANVGDLNVKKKATINNLCVTDVIDLSKAKIIYPPSCCDCDCDWIN